MPRIRRERQTWDVDIRKDQQGYRLVRARMKGGRHWYPPQNWPKEVIFYATCNDDLQGLRVTDEDIVELLDGMEWNGDGRPADKSEPYFTEELYIDWGSKWSDAECHIPRSFDFECNECEYQFSHSEGLRTSSDFGSGCDLLCPDCWSPDLYSLPLQGGNREILL